MKAINKPEAVALITETNGKVFSAIFIKKDGSERTMNCRTQVSKGVKGVGLKFDPTNYNLVQVYDMNAKGFRFINLNTLKALQISGKAYIMESKSKVYA